MSYSCISIGKACTSVEKATLISVGVSCIETKRHIRNNLLKFGYDGCSPTMMLFLRSLKVAL